jgi:AmmeMemoRadiSam system protein B/AmmeMemoRadiSam system protein A
MLRMPVFAGQFYPDSPEELRAMLDSFIRPQEEKEEVTGILAPHAGYIYSGAITGAVVSRIKIKDTFIILGPNHTGLGKPFSIMTEGAWQTPLGEVQIDSELAKKLVSNSRFLQEDTLAHENEHSIEVQLPFLQYFKPEVKIVPIVIGGGGIETFRQIGLEIAQTMRDLKREAVIFASSDMNHYEPQMTSRKKDYQAINAILDMDADKLIQRVEEQDISMCGYAPAAIMITASRESGGNKALLVRYQTSGDVSGDFNAVVGYAGIIIKKLSPLVELARDALESFVRDKKIIQPAELTPEMKEKAGVFVCIKKEGELRGCIGTFEPYQENVADEIIANAISTSSHDPRFEPVTVSELKDLDYTVDVLTRPEPVSGPDKLDPKKYGVIVESGYLRGLLLPDLEGVDTVEMQIEIAREKAGISPGAPIQLYRFEVKRYK